jgi:hypothetical protein
MCLSDGAVPVRLTHVGSVWTLQIYRLVGVARDVYRPRYSKIHGEAQVLAFLKLVDGSGVLYRSTARLTRRMRSIECEFMAENGGWLPKPLRLHVAARRPMSSSASALRNVTVTPGSGALPVPEAPHF